MKKVFHGMFARLMTVMLAAILACVLVLYSLFYFTIRADHIDARMNELKRQDYDIAYLASRVHNNSIAESFGYNSTTENYIKWKANTIYSDFNAYSVVVDRTGKTTLYATPELMKEEDMIFDQQKIVSILSRVLHGEEIIFRTQSGGKPMFTVAVPWADRGWARCLSRPPRRRYTPPMRALRCRCSPRRWSPARWRRCACSSRPGRSSRRCA